MKLSFQTSSSFTSLSVSSMSMNSRVPAPVAVSYREDLRQARSLVSRMPPDSKKEVFQPHLPVRLPCYDLAPVTGLALGRSFRSRTSGTPDSHGLTGGVYKARERIHRAMADARLLANPASWSRVADSSPNWDGFYGFPRCRHSGPLCFPPL